MAAEQVLEHQMPAEHIEGFAAPEALELSGVMPRSIPGVSAPRLRSWLVRSRRPDRPRLRAAG
jgi:hypothetical protein